MNSRAAGKLAVALCLLSFGAAHADPGKTPAEWLDRMSTTMSQMSYQGTFVYIQGDDVETMRITHVAGEDGIHERLVAVSGPAREIVRDASGVRWVLGDDLSVLEDKSFGRTFFPQLPLDQKEQSDFAYRLKFGKDARIAGQAARNIKVLPLDDYRYGYSLWLEKHSGMLLQWELVDSRRQPLAKLMFTDIRLGSAVDTGELKPSSDLKKLKRVESKLPTGRFGSLAASRWQPADLPPGFRLTSHRYLGQDEADEGQFEHLVYSDGLAAVSVYIESVPDVEKFSESMDRHGTMHAYSRSADGVMITVIGDVPAITVKKIGKAVSLASR